MLSHLLIAFLVGGAICCLIQIIMDITPFSFTNSHVLVFLILSGEIAGFFGWYPRLAEVAMMGASVPLCGFGSTLMEGVFHALKTQGLLGLLSGGFTAGAVGLAVALACGLLVAAFAKPKG